MSESSDDESSIVVSDRSDFDPSKKGDSVLTFAKDLDRIKRKQLEFSIKLENEKARKKYLDECVHVTKKKYYELQTKTKNGWVARESYIQNNRTIQLGEQKLQAAKIKLSLAKTENVNLHSKIDYSRREKLLQIQIYKNAQVELEKITEIVKKAQDDITTYINRKQQAGNFQVKIHLLSIIIRDSLLTNSHIYFFNCGFIFL